MLAELPGAAGRATLAALLAGTLVLGACQGDEPEVPEVAATSPSPTPTPDPTCPLTGLDAPSAEVAERPAVAVKVENNPVAYPLSGLEDAEVVYEEVVEGGLTRFLAIYHCTDAAKVGPVRSSREIDPGIMIPVTRILGAAGGNAIVRKALDKGEIVLVDEDAAGKAMRRIPRSGITFEHTLYGSTKALRKIGQRKFEDPPPENTFLFGPPVGDGKRARSVTINFSAGTVVSYRYKGGTYRRFDGGDPLPIEGGKQIEVENVIIEQHTVNYSNIIDPAGNPSIVFADETGRGLAVLFRGGKAYRGRWIRETKDGQVRFETRSGEQMAFSPGTVWIELLPDRKGEVKGSFSISKK